MTSKASSLVAGAKQWATYYGGFPNGTEGAALTAELRARAAWTANDADAFADIFVDNGSMLVGDRQLMTREEIRAYMAEAFAGGYKGSRLVEEPIDVRLISASVAVVITQGGVVRDGADAVAATDEIRTMWIVVRHDGDWWVSSYQSSPVKG